ncbi:MAG TPA: quinone oxidoreductase [Candidatus Dormibacteraeota bacterium]|jgi:NADPH2:quinone reductase
MKAVSVSRYGGPEVLEIVDVDTPSPGAGQVLVDVAFAGVNFMDIYARSGVGQYAETPPFVLGGEGSGRVLAVGDGVSGFAPGQRVVWKAARGSYAELVAAPAAELVPVPDAVSDEAAAAVFLQGLTAHYLVHSTHPIQTGEVVVVHAAAGGVGLLLTQMATLRGARVVGTVSSAEKERLAREAGAAEVVRYDQTTVSDAVRELTGGEGAAAVYDGVGQATFEESLKCLRPRGMLVLFGASSGQVPPFDLHRLASAGSLFVTRPTLVHYTRDRAELLDRAVQVLDLVANGRLRVHIGGRHALADAQQAHRDLESRRTVGKLLLIP